MAGEHSKLIRLRIRTADEAPALGPGKADLLELISVHGSISAAAREMGMSYRRAWGLVQVMNRAFREPLVHTTAGGASQGGAELTRAGAAVLKEYRAAEAAAAKAAAPAIKKLMARLRDPNRG